MLANNPHLQKKRNSKKGLGRSLMKRITEIPETMHLHRQCSRDDGSEHGSNRSTLRRNPFEPSHHGKPRLQHGNEESQLVISKENIVRACMLFFQLCIPKLVKCIICNITMSGWVLFKKLYKWGINGTLQLIEKIVSERFNNTGLKSHIRVLIVN